MTCQVEGTAQAKTKRYETVSCLGMNPEGMVCAESGSGMVVGSTLLRVTLKNLNLLLRPMVNN